MKKVCFLITVLLAWAGNTFADNLSGSDVAMTPGEERLISIELSNTEHRYISFQFDLELPMGISVANDSQGGLKASIDASRSVNGTSFTVKDIGNNRYRFLAFTNGTAFTGNSGPLVNISLSASEEMPDTVCEAQLTALKFTNIATEQQRLAESAFKITVSSIVTSVKIGSLFYQLNIKTHTAEVVASDANITSASIPAAITYNGISCDVTQIGENAFNNSTLLQSVDIAASVTSIGQNAFSKCSKLTRVTVNNPVPTDISEDVFPYCQNATLYVPAGCYAAYHWTDCWEHFKSIIDGADVNCDGEIDETDVEIVSDCIAGWKYYSRSDVNKDGKTDITDIVIINDCMDGF